MLQLLRSFFGTSQKFFLHFSEVLFGLPRSPLGASFRARLSPRRGYHLESGLRLTVRYIELFCRRGIHLSQRHALCVLDQSSSKQHPYMSAWCLRLCFLPRGVDVPPKLLRSMGSTDPLLTPAPYSAKIGGHKTVPDPSSPIVVRRHVTVEGAKLL